LGQRPQSPQQRKKRVLEQVEKGRRRQRAVTLIVIGAVLVAIIVGGIYALSNQSKSNLPDYLNVCVGGAGQAYHAHAHLTISINGAPQAIPGDVGRNGGCLRPLHTHATDGVIHIEPDQERTFKLGDFFLIWNPNQPFNATRFMNQKYSAGQLTMTVNGISDQSLQNYVFPRNAQFATDTCSVGSCQNVDIAITLNNPAQSAY